MAIELKNGVTLPDIPADVLAQYPYWVVIEEVGTTTMYRLLLTESKFGYLSQELASAFGYGFPMVGTTNPGLWIPYSPSDGDVDWNESNAEEMTPMIGTPVGYAGECDYTLVAANHDVKVIEAVDASYNVTWSDVIYFLNSTIEYEPEYSAPSSWFVGIADQARRLSGVTKRYDRDAMLEAFKSMELATGIPMFINEFTESDADYEGQTLYVSDLSEFAFTANDGEIYTVIFDGVEYECTAYNANVNGVCIIGNLAMGFSVGSDSGEEYEYEDTGEPFCIVSELTELDNVYFIITYIETTLAGDTHTVAITRKGLGNNGSSSNIDGIPSVEGVKF